MRIPAQVPPIERVRNGRAINENGQVQAAELGIVSCTNEPSTFRKPVGYSVGRCLNYNGTCREKLTGPQRGNTCYLRACSGC